MAVQLEASETVPLVSTHASGSCLNFCRGPPLRYRSRLFRSKTATVILVWNVLLATIRNLGLVTVYSYKWEPNKGTSMLFGAPRVLSALIHVNTLAYVVYPLAVLIADVTWGRYKMVVFSGLSGFFLSVSAIVVGVVGQYMNEDTVTPFLSLGLIVATLLVQYLYFVNAFLLGMDQLHDASSEELCSFVHWYVWSECVGGLVLILIYVDLRSKPDTLPVIMGVLLTALLAAGLAVLICHCRCLRLSSLFVTVPPSVTSYKTVRKVLASASRQHTASLPGGAAEHVRETGLLGRIELSKGVHGGPCTTEEVDDVKTSLRLIPLLVPVAASFFLQFAALPNPVFVWHFENHTTNQTSELERNSDITNALSISYLYGVVYITLHELVLYPVLGKYLPRAAIRLWLAMLTLLVAIIFNLMTDAIRHALNRQDSACMFVDYYNGMSEYSLGLSPLLLLVPGALSSIATIILYIALLEFAAAQVPYSMKGLFIGLGYCLAGLFSGLGSVFIQPFEFWTPGHYYSCCSLYYTLNGVIGVLLLIFFTVVVCNYTPRQRSDVNTEQSLPPTGQAVKVYYAMLR